MSAALELIHLCKSFGTQQAVNRLSLAIDPGEIFGLLGPNGAGKSTTINMIGGVTRIGSGEIRIFGHPVRRSARQSRHARRLTGIMHQELVADPFFTIHQALSLHPGFFGQTRDPGWYHDLVERLELRPHLHKAMNHLSGGLKRRFMLAKALIHKPKLLILDEPTAGVDVELRHTLWDFVREINAQGTTVLLTTHYLEEAEQMCDRIAIMKEGRLLALDRTPNLMRSVEGRHIRFTLKKALKKLPDELSGLRAKIQDDGFRLSLHSPNQMTVFNLIDLLRQRGIEVADVDTFAPSLEEVFLQLTQPEPSEICPR
ncbi:MAG: ABC transporter ATP-binding protein [Desulfuromonadaceae bacterium]|nr:ABC transporter ATP-binding protein [Desulfuromonadaceae bacterium]